MNNEAGIYFVHEASGVITLVHNEALKTVQQKLDTYNETNSIYHNAQGRYVVGPWIDFANGPVVYPDLEEVGR